MPGRAPGQSRTEDPALPAAAHCRPAGPRTTQTQDQDPGELALGPGTRNLLPGHLRATGADLTRPVARPSPTRYPARPVEPAPARATPGAPGMTTHRKQDQERRRRSPKPNPGPTPQPSRMIKVGGQSAIDDVGKPPFEG